MCEQEMQKFIELGKRQHFGVVVNKNNELMIVLYSCHGNRLTLA